MIALLLPFIGKALPFIVAAIGALFALWRYGSSKKAEGRTEAINEVTVANEQAQAEIAKNAEANAGLDDAALDRKLSDPQSGDH